MIIAVVAILVFIVIGLIIYNVTIHKKIQKFRNLNQKITNLYVVQDFMNAIGETSTVEDKIKKINDILIERYEIKYSTIVVFDGAEYHRNKADDGQMSFFSSENIKKYNLMYPE